MQGAKRATLEATQVSQLEETTAQTVDILQNSRNLDQSIRKLTEDVREADDCVFLKDRTGRILFCNENFRRYFANGIPSPIGKKGSEFLPNGLQELSDTSDCLVLDGDCTRIQVEYSYEQSDGSQGRATTIKIPLLDGEDKITGVLGISQPIAEVPRGSTLAELEPLGAIVNSLRPVDRQVAKFVCEGLSNKEIAARLDNPLRTIENRRRSILKKLGANSTAELIKIMVRLEDAGIIQLGV